MNFWLKIISALSALACLLGISALCWLAMRTTDSMGAAQSVTPASFAPEQGSASGDLNHLNVLANLLPIIADETNKLAARLTEINQSPGVVRNELVLTFKSPRGLQEFRDRAASQGFDVISSDPRLLAARVRYNSPAAMAQELQSNAGDYENIGLNYLVWVPGLPEEPQTDASNAGGRAPFGNSGLDAIGAEGDRSSWGRGVTVAVLDTGVTDHPSLAHAQVTHYDLVKDGQQPNGHGTAMASLVVGNGADSGGVAVGSRILDLRVADAKGESNTALVADAIMQAVDQGARVINISMGTTGDSMMLRRAVAYAQERGAVVVAAAGNEQQASLAYPAGYQGVVSVGAVDAAGVQAYFSNSGATLTISAPGVGIISAYSDGRTVIGSGTSQATAITSGVVSTLLGWGYSSHNIPQVLANAAQSTGAPREQVGAGLLQLPKR